MKTDKDFRKERNVSTCYPKCQCLYVWCKEKQKENQRCRRKGKSRRRRTQVCRSDTSKVLLGGRKVLIFLLFIFMKRYIIFLVLISTVLLLASCDLSTDQQQSLQQEQSLQEANKEVGMPAIVNFQERKLAKQILEARDQENLQTYAYLYSQQTGKLIFLWKSIGYWLPYSTQYTNPQVDTYLTTSWTAHIVLPQADPNGLFSPPNTNATWVMLIDPTTNKPRPVYIEPDVILSPFPLTTN